MGYGQILAHLTGPISLKAFNISLKPNDLGPTAISSHHCRCQSPSTAIGRPTPATSGNFSGGLQQKKKKKSCIFFF
jgi:hypothetical protein